MKLFLIKIHDRNTRIRECINDFEGFEVSTCSHFDERGRGRHRVKIENESTFPPRLLRRTLFPERKQGIPRPIVPESAVVSVSVPRQGSPCAEGRARPT